MSDEATAQEDSAKAAPKAGGSKMVPVFLAINSALLIGVLAFLVVRNGHAATGKESKSSEESKGESKAEGASDMGPTVKLPDFVVHLRNPEADRYARISFEIEMVSEPDKTALTPYLPRVRDAFITYLADRTAEELRGSEGLDRIKHDLTKVIEGIVPGHIVRTVFIADFVLQ